METGWNENRAVLRGVVAAPPVPSHENHGVRYDLFPLTVRRLSGVEDRLNIIAAAPLLQCVPLQPGDQVEVEGEVRSFNNRSGQGSRLVITLLARALTETEEPPCNQLTLSGVLCKPPILRRTPLGREICDLVLAVNRRDGRADYAVLPIENSSTGAIRHIYDLLSQYEYFIVGETTVRVEHCLMALPGATLDTITHVYSHEQGLFQCEQYLAAHPGWRTVPQADTAGSAQMVASSRDMTKAAICSERAAQLYGLNILARGINHNSRNTTRFVVVSPWMELREGADKISTMFLLPHEAGSLHEILTIFAVRGLNLVKLESRPLPERSWEYLFFLEFNGHLDQQITAGVLHELAQTTGDFRVLGNFQSNLG